MLAAISTVMLPALALAQNSAYVQTNLISDGAVPAAQMDPTLINPWGVSIGPQFWIDAAGSGFSLVEDGNGAKAFAVAVPPAASTSPHGTPAGTVYNSDASLFPITGGSAQFLFGTLDGTIAAWNPSTPQAVTVVNNASAGAVYTGLAVETASSGSFLLAANFASGTVDVFDSNFKPAQLTGTFSDPTIPTGFAPFGIHFINGKVFVTYAQRNAQGRENVGAGLGYVDVFDTNGNLLQQAIGQGNLNAPWGMALAPAGFGSLGGDLLIGNFGDGVINAYDPNTFSFIGSVKDSTGRPIANSGLWEIVFGVNGVGDPNTLYFAAGINAEKDGLFGSIAVAAATPGTANFSLASSASAITVTATQPGTATLSLTSMNNFSGAITLSCSGLPSNATCSFTPASINLASSGTQNVTVSFAEVTTPGNPQPYNAARLTPGFAPVAFGLLAPAGILLLGLRRRLQPLFAGILTVLVACVFAVISGCSGYKAPSSTATLGSGGTPATIPVMVNATSGTITQSVPLNVTLQ